MTTSDSGRMRQSTRGRKKWPDSVLLLRNLPISAITLLSVFVRHTCVSVATISSQWWKSRLSCTIQQSLHRSTIHHCGHTQCTSECHIAAMEIFRLALLALMPSGKWSWMNSIDVRIQLMMNICQVVLWLTRAQTFWLVSFSLLPFIKFLRKHFYF